MSHLLPIATPARTWAVVRELLGQHRKLALAAVTGLLIATAIGLATAPLLGRIVDLVADGQPATEITTPVVLLAVCAVARGAATALALTLVAGVGERILARLRERFVDRALNLPLEQVERAGSGDLTARVSDDVTVIAEAVHDAVPALVSAAFTIALTLVGMAVLDWRFLLAALLAAPVQWHTVRWYAGRAGPLYAQQRVAVGAQQHQLLDTIGGATTVRALQLTTEHLDRVDRRSQSAVDLALRGVRLVTRFYARLNLAEYIGLAAVLTTGFLLVRNGQVSVGTATAAALYFHGLFNPITTALALVDDAQSATASVARLVGVADQPARVFPSDPKSEPLEVLVKGVHHAYDSGSEVLHGIDLRIAPGERVALVGASGAGKTTLAKLIAGVHEPSSGEVQSPRVVLITQEVHVFAGSLTDDLRLARPDATDDEVAAALASVGAWTWAQALPEGLATVVGAGGHRLNLVQAQQLALARLILADPPVVVLDEATADAGSAGARILEAATAEAFSGRSALIVAHRLTQAAAADRVIVLDSGRVVEEGTHDDLVSSGGRYAQLWTAWSATRTGVPNA